jgi:large subunit ribosomal protein L16
MLFPIKTKFNKVNKSRIIGIDTSVYNPRIGFYGIKSITLGRITSQQIESIKKLILRKIQQLGRAGVITIRVFPFLPITCKPAESRMGKGKGNFSYWCFPVKPGRLLVEFQGVSQIKAVNIYKLVNSKLCFKTRLVKNI